MFSNFDFIFPQNKSIYLFKNLVRRMQILGNLKFSDTKKGNVNK